MAYYPISTEVCIRRDIRSAGCSYGDIVANLEDRYGQPATVAAACIEMLTVGPKVLVLSIFLF